MEAGKGGFSYSGYRAAASGTPNDMVNETRRGTPGGEYLRRFWQPVACLNDVVNAPLRVRIMGEDLVVFRDKSGAVGVLHLHCSHRGTSLEFGRVEEHGIRCCYHGRVFDVDGTILEMPGEPAVESLRREYRQGAYPVHVFAGLVFAYMGPLELKPPFPIYDRWNVPGMRLAPGPCPPFACSWVQVKENAMDPAHTAVLHAWEGRFASEFGKFPEITWMETPIGMAYVAARRIGDRIWIRSTDIMAPNIHSITSVFENGRDLKECSPPWLTNWTVPVDDDSCINFGMCHVPEDDRTPDDVRNNHMLATGGQTPARPYAERQRVPGDYDAIVSQGATAPHSLEHLGTLDQGVTMFRRLLRQGIRDVQEGRDPIGMVRTSEVIPTYGSDRVVPDSAMSGDPDDAAALMEFARLTGKEYLKSPPLQNRKVPRPPAEPPRRPVSAGA
jgi:nitrite reductase/ring-hydroxylating ferredoxin subunit